MGGDAKKVAAKGDAKKVAAKGDAKPAAKPAAKADAKADATTAAPAKLFLVTDSEEDGESTDHTTTALAGVGVFGLAAMAVVVIRRQSATPPPSDQAVE